MRLPLLVLAVVVAAAAPRPGHASEEAATAAAAPAPATVADASPAPGRLPRWGVALGAGFPDFGTAELMFRPLPFLRLRAGPAWNAAAWGLQGGVELVPWNWALSPILSLHAGKFLRSDYSSFAKDEEDAKALLERVDYQYAAVDVGVDIGSPRGFSVALRLGLSFVSVASRGRATYASDTGSTVTLADPSLAATLPSAKLALQYWF